MFVVIFTVMTRFLFLLLLYSCSSNHHDAPVPVVNPAKEARIEIFLNTPVDSSSTVIIGTSVSAGIPDFLLPDNTVNFGLDGGTCADFKPLLPYIVSSHPKKLIIELGINDLKNDIHNLPSAADRLVDSISIIVTLFKEHSPTTSVFIQSILPVNDLYFDSYSDSMNAQILSVNEGLKTIPVTFINLHPHFLSNSILNPDLTYDGLHLNLKGYQIWRNSLPR